MAVAATTMPYARQGHGGGIATAFLSGTSAAISAATAGIVGLAAGLACLIAWRPGPGAVVLGSELFAAIVVLWFARRRIGGFTGDVLGAMGIIAETVALVVAAARW